LPTGVGLRYEQRALWVEAFLGGLGPDDYRFLTEPRRNRYALETGICLGLALRVAHRSCSFERLILPTASPHPSQSECLWCRNADLLSIAYDCYVLGLGLD
jgi:hypothetical protein